MQGDDPPYLSVGTAVSAKYKGAFCEAKVSKVVRVVKCKVTYKMGLGTATVSDEQIKGPLRVGQVVQAKHSDKKEYVEATISKIQDCSQYTVVFDDGDITTLRRTALCLKSGRHFNESETLDQLPLTHPEHFGNPVVGGRRGRRSRQLKEDSSEGEVEEENEPDLEVYTMEVGRVVCVEASDKKRNKDNWFPGLVVMPSAQPTVRINVKDEFLVRSFKDGRYYTVPQKEVSEFSRDMASKIESTMLVEAVEKVMRYLDNDELPVHWERSLLFHNSMQTASSDSDEHFTDLQIFSERKRRKKSKKRKNKSHASDMEIMQYNDEFDTVCASFAMKLRKMEPKQQILAESIMHKVVTQGLLNQLTEHVDIVNTRFIPSAYLPWKQAVVRSSTPLKSNSEYSSCTSISNNYESY